MIWVGLVVAFLVILLVAAFLILRKGTLYFPNDSGYVAFSSGAKEARRRITRQQFASLLPIVFQGQKIDFLQISYNDGENDGVVISNDGNEITLWRDFRPATDSESIIKFKEAMTREGYVPSIDPWNVGLGPEMESISINYSLPADASLIERLVYISLDTLEGNSDGDLYANADLIGNGPGDKIAFKKKRDLLEGLLES